MQTGDAIALLGTLRPDTALLLTPTSELGQHGSPDVAGSLSLKPTVSTSSAGTLFAKENTLPCSPAELAASSFAPSAGSATTEIAVSHLELGDHVLVRPGALPPSDGTIVRGQTAFDESSLTGEARPVAKRVGDVVLTGTVNVGREAVVVRVDSLGEDTMLARIGKAVEGAMSGKSRIEELAERITGVFVPCVVRQSALSAWVPLASADMTSFAGLLCSDCPRGLARPDAERPDPRQLDQGSRHPDDRRPSLLGVRVLHRRQCLTPAILCRNESSSLFPLPARQVLVVACPCGIGLAAPTATAVGLGLAAQAGVLAQGGGSAFQAATKVDTVVFDKCAAGQVSGLDLSVWH